MIELRWLVSPRNDVDRVLQFRVMGEYPHSEISVKGPRWGAWQGVPEVVYSPAAKE